jgi:eukaryotic-like serine/threonine-protein kinase
LTLISPGDLSGTLIAGKYELLRLLGRGGMGAVYEARNTGTLKRCAVKLLLTPELAGDAEVVRRFFREARASGLIESEHVVAAFDSGSDQAGNVYYVMECLRGEDLEQALDRLGQLDPISAAKIILQAAKGLACAHALGIVHRDVKPANLFLALGPGDEIKVKILDFGVAKVKMEMFNESSNTLTQGGSLLGTPLYMSPEQLRRASSIEASADVWSLGVVLFECLTGALPWGDCHGIGELVTAILTARLPLVQDLAPWVQPELAEMVQRALSRDPEQRLRSAAELRDALVELIGADTRLFLHQIRAPDEQQRSSRAPRLAIADTVMIGPMPPHSSMPVVTTTAPARPTAPGRRAPAIALAAAGLAGALAWTMTRPPSAPLSSSLLPNAVSAPAVPVPSAVTPLLDVPPEPEPASFALEVGPPNALVSVDGKPVPVKEGKVLLDGPVGSVRSLRVSLGGRSRDARVAITHDGLVPARVWAPAASVARDNVTVKVETEPKPSEPAIAPVASSPTSDLSQWQEEDLLRSR